MRTAMVLLTVGAVIAMVVLVACRARDDSAADTTADESARADGLATDSLAAVDTGSVSPSVPLDKVPRASAPTVRREQDPPRDSTLPPEDSIRAMRPKLPQVTPPKRPRTWRGFKLPEEMPVRVPIETIGRVDQVPDSTTKGDSTKPPTPDR